MVSRIVRAPALGRLRLACVEDAHCVMDIMSESMKMNFRVHDSSDVVYLIENCILSICQLDVKDAIIGFIAAKDYPLLPSVHPRAWEEYIWTKYKAIELNARNTLFLHLMCWNPGSGYGRELVDSMLKSMFMHDPYLHYIGMLKTLTAYPLLVAGNSRPESSFRRVAAVERGMSGDMLPGLCIADRSEVCPRLKIRRAVEEDNDDIVPILERHTPLLQQMYGEFYISELISRHPDSERVLLVCEHKEVAVGVMCLNTQINYEALEENFELSAFGGLRHIDLGTKSDSGKMESVASFTGLGDDPMQTSSQLLELNAKTNTEVTFNKDESSDAPVNFAAAPTATPSLTAVLDILHLFEDEEEIDFDIVNIDNDLLKVPKIMETTNKGVDNITKPLNASSTLKDFDLGLDRVPKKSKLSVGSSVTSILRASHNPVHYSGPPNAFLLELFAMHPEYDERHGFDMLEVAYELFPDRDYCVMCLPSRHPSFPLLEHFTLVTPYSSKTLFINETLYVAHVNSVRGNVSVRPGEAHDLNCLGDLLEHAPRAQAQFKLFETALESPQLNSFILLSQKQPIGVIVVGPIEDDGVVIRARYALEPESRRSCTDGNILVGVMSPALEPHGRWFLRDVLRQSHYTTLFWICKLFARGEEKPDRNLMSLAAHMAPVRPRSSLPNMSGYEDLDNIFQDVAAPFALWVLERPLSSLPKVYVNNSIVVVGASRTGLAFIETLIMGPASQYLTFSNITLVSENGLPAAIEYLKAANTCIPRQGRYTDRYLKSVPFIFYVDVISAVMTKIDRKTKCIHFKDGMMKFYDELVLTCGKQFQHPDYLHESLELVKEVLNGKPCERILMDNPEYKPDRVPPSPETPDNLFLINSLHDANYAMKKLLLMIKDTEDSLCQEKLVIVYGECLEAYSCLASLLELGLSPAMLAFVEPFPPDEANSLRVNCFNDETVDERVQSTIEMLGVRVLRRCTLSGWRQVHTRIEAVHLMAPLHQIKLPCFAFFYYGIKAIDIHAFRAINESGLVYDGGLIVGPSFETNDSNIYGAGPCTRYSRRLYASRLQQNYYCSEDVGEALARIFLRKLDPFIMCNSRAEQPSSQDLLSRFSSSLLTFKDSHGSIIDGVKLNLGISRRWQPVMKFDSPLVQFTTMPGPLYYMTVRKPGPVVPMEVHLSLPHQGHTLTTDKHGNYFRLQLNALHCVEAVTCLSKEEISPVLLGQLYGKHEAYFNKLLARYKLGEIEDLYQFFTQPWMAAMYHDTFNDFLRDINGDGTDTQRLGMFHSVIEKLVARSKNGNECGQSASLRDEANALWRYARGEDVVSAHLSRHLARHRLINPHYAYTHPQK